MMWPSRLFWKLFLASSGLIVLAVSVCSAIVAARQEEQLTAQFQRRLRDSAMLLTEQVGGKIAAGRTADLQTQVRRLGQATETRFTVLDADGVVLADSAQSTLAGVAAMENHLARQEFMQAQHSGAGQAQRLSPTLQIPFLYYAVPVRAGAATLGYVRAAQPLAEIAAAVTAMRYTIWLVSWGVGFAGLLLTFWLTGRIVRPIQSLTEAAEQIAAGQIPHRVSVSGPDDLGSLARAFQGMIEKLRAREADLRESIDRQAAVLAGMQEGVLAVDKDQHMLFANLAAGQTFGFDSAAVENRTLLEVVRSNDLREIVERTLATMLPVQGEIQWQASPLLTLNVNATPLPGEPCPGVVLALHDITEIRRLENLRQQLVANVSHELKTPLSSIKAYTETLLGGAIEDSAHARPFLERIDDQADRLHELILDMLSLARIEAGQGTMEMTQVALSRVAKTCMADYEARAASAQVCLRNEISQAELTVHANEESLLQILGNLIDNALKYTPAGGTITLRCHRQEDHVVLEVTDTGIGIDPVHHERLFERFYRVDKARSRELGGTGLGLAIVKHLCQAMDGSVAVESTPGAGSTFRVVVPL